MSSPVEPVFAEFFFDIGSPYSYLAASQMDELGARTGARIWWRPFLLGGVFKATGNVPPATLPARAPVMLTDLMRWAAHYGIPLAFPSYFPGNMLQTQRALIAAERASGEASMRRFAARLFTAYWAEGVDVSRPGVLEDLADEVELDGAALVAATADPSIKQALLDATQSAVERGAFGAPTFFVGQELFFGNDRLMFVEAALRPRSVRT